MSYNKDFTLTLSKPYHQYSKVSWIEDFFNAINQVRDECYVDWFRDTYLPALKTSDNMQEFLEFVALNYYGIVRPIFSADSINYYDTGVRYDLPLTRMNINGLPSVYDSLEGVAGKLAINQFLKLVTFILDYSIEVLTSWDICKFLANWCNVPLEDIISLVADDEVYYYLPDTTEAVQLVSLKSGDALSFPFGSEMKFIQLIYRWVTAWDNFDDDADIWLYYSTTLGQPIDTSERDCVSNEFINYIPIEFQSTAEQYTVTVDNPADLTLEFDTALVDTGITLNANVTRDVRLTGEAIWPGNVTRSKTLNLHLRPWEPFTSTNTVGITTKTDALVQLDITPVQAAYRVEFEQADEEMRLFIAVPEENKLVVRYIEDINYPYQTEIRLIRKTSGHEETLTIPITVTGV